jgi:hypothetical protein
MTQKFFTGDIVRYVGRSKTWARNQEMVVHDAQYQGEGTFEYSTTSGAWFSDEDFVLIRRADAESFAELDRHFEGEEE